MLRRLRDALILLLAAANAHHLLVAAGRYYSARRAQHVYVDRDLTHWRA